MPRYTLRPVGPAGDSYDDSDGDSSILTTSSSSRHGSHPTQHFSEPIIRSHRTFRDSEDLREGMFQEEEEEEEGLRGDYVDGDTTSEFTSTSFRMYPIKGNTCQGTTGPSYLQTDNRHAANTSSFATSWLDPDKLAADLEKIIPNFDFRSSVTFGSMFDGESPAPSATSSSCHSEASSVVSGEDDVESYMSAEWVPRNPRQSWSGNLDTSIIDVIDMIDMPTPSPTECDVTSFPTDTDSGAVRRQQQHHRRVKRRRDSFDRSFRRPRPVSTPVRQSLLIDNATVIKFESQPCPYSIWSQRLPIFQILKRQKFLSTTLVIDRYNLTIKFTSQKDYFCSSFKIQKHKISIKLVDIVNVIVISNSNTVIIQYSDASSGKLRKKDKESMTKISDTLRSSRSASLNRSSNSGSNLLSNIAEIEIGRYSNAEQLASLILKRREGLIPKPILKRGSLKRKKKPQPQIIKVPTDKSDCATSSRSPSDETFEDHVALLPEPEPFVEFLSYV